MNWLLLIVIVILVVNAFIGRKVGLIKMVFSICSLVVALVLTVWISPIVKDYMKGNEKLYSSVTEKVDKMLPLDAGDTEENTYIDKLPLPQSIKDSLIENKNSEVRNALPDFRGYISTYLTGIIMNAMAFIVSFVVILIILWIICFALNIISKLPILNQINKTAGFLAGLVQGLIYVWIFFILITVFGSAKFGQDAMKMIEESKVLSLIYDNNFLLRFITSATKILF